MWNEDLTAKYIREIAQERSLERCFEAAAIDFFFNRHPLEHMRAALFRAEQLVDEQSLPTKLDFFAFLPHDLAAMFESLKTVTKCMEEWQESKACQAILAHDLQRPNRKAGKAS